MNRRKIRLPFIPKLFLLAIVTVSETAWPHNLAALDLDTINMWVSTHALNVPKNKVSWTYFEDLFSFITKFKLDVFTFVFCLSQTFITQKKKTTTHLARPYKPSSISWCGDLAEAVPTKNEIDISSLQTEARLDITHYRFPMSFFTINLYGASRFQLSTYGIE